MKTRKSLKEKIKINFLDITSYLESNNYDLLLVTQALAEFRRYFDIPDAGQHFTTFLFHDKARLPANPRRMYDVLVKVRNTPGIQKRRHVDDLSQVEYEVSNCAISDLKLFKHLLAAKKVLRRNVHQFYLHLVSLPTTKWLVIDRDIKNIRDEGLMMAQFVVDLPKIMKAFGRPNIINTSRSGFGYHFHFLLDKHYPIATVQAFARAQLATVGINDKTWEIFPKGDNQAMTPLPFGRNSKQIIRGRLAKAVGLDAMLDWYSNHKLDHVLNLPGVITRGVPIVDINTKTDDLSEKLTVTPCKSAAVSCIESGIITKADVDQLFSKPELFSRRQAQQILKYHFLFTMGLNLNDAVEEAWVFLSSKDFNSKDVKKNSRFAKNDLVKYFKKGYKRINETYSGSSHITDFELKHLYGLLHKHEKALDTFVAKNKPITKRAIYFAFFYIYHHLKTKKGAIGFYSWADLQDIPCNGGSIYVKSIACLVELGLIKKTKGITAVKNGAFYRSKTKYALNVSIKVPKTAAFVYNFHLKAIADCLKSSMPVKEWGRLFGSGVLRRFDKVA